jgi:hypothetical protein
MRKEIVAERRLWTNEIDVFVATLKDDRRYFLHVGLVKEVEEGSIISMPTMTLTSTEAQKLMDELWGCGLRPSEGTGSAGSLAATQNHLKDMQNIAFMLLNRQTGK